MKSYFNFFFSFSTLECSRCSAALVCRYLFRLYQVPPSSSRRRALNIERARSLHRRGKKSTRSHLAMNADSRRIRRRNRRWYGKQNVGRMYLRARYTRPTMFESVVWWRNCETATRHYCQPPETAIKQSYVKFRSRVTRSSQKKLSSRLSCSTTRLAPTTIDSHSTSESEDRSVEFQHLSATVPVVVVGFCRVW